MATRAASCLTHWASPGMHYDLMTDQLSIQSPLLMNEVISVFAAVTMVELHLWERPRDARMASQVYLPDWFAAWWTVSLETL